MDSLIDELIKGNLITKEQIDDARDKQIGAKKPIQELLVDMGFISEENLMKVLSKTYNMPVVKLEEEERDGSVLNTLSWEKAKRYGVFPLRKEKNVLVLAMSNPQDVILYRSDFPVISTFVGSRRFLAEGVVASIEVKSRLDAEEFKRALVPIDI